MRRTFITRHLTSSRPIFRAICRGVLHSQFVTQTKTNISAVVHHLTSQIISISRRWRQVDIAQLLEVVYQCYIIVTTAWYHRYMTLPLRVCDHKKTVSNTQYDLSCSAVVHFTLYTSRILYAVFSWALPARQLAQLIITHSVQKNLPLDRHSTRLIISLSTRPSCLVVLQCFWFT